MDEGRERQFAIWRSWTLQQRWAAMGRMTATALAFRDRRLKEMHPDLDETSFRALRIQATMASSASRRFP